MSPAARPEGGGPSEEGQARVFLTLLVSDEPLGSQRLNDLVDDGAVVVLARDRHAVARLLLPRDETPAADDAPEELRSAKIRVDLKRHEVICRGQPMSLSESEFRLLSTLMSDTERAFAYEELETAVWSCAFLGDRARLRSAVKRLRTKLAAASAGVDIEAVRGLGFRLSRPCLLTPADAHDPDQ